MMRQQKMSGKNSRGRLALFGWASFALAAVSFTINGATAPTPKEHFGFDPGDDYKLADYSQITSYFEQLSHASDRLKWVEFGRTSMGKPMYAAFISSPENLKKLGEFREINRKLAMGRVTDEEAKTLAEKGKVFVWIDSGLHASEVAPSQQAPHLAYRLVTEENDEMKAIRRNTIVIQVPCINPDGLDMIVDWYRSNVGSPFEAAPMPWLYQKYAGHDNNRDWFMLNLEETRNVTKLLFQTWYPQIVYNQHQAAPFPARIFVPPYAEPLNPNIPASVMEGINQIGSAIKDRFAREQMPGAISYWGYDGWWNGGLRSVPAFHNMHGILTETAGERYATPMDYKESDFRPRFENGLPTKEPTIFYERPWHGGHWTLRDQVSYMLTADMAILDLASERGRDFLYKSYAAAQAEIHLGETTQPFAYAIPEKQWDRTAARELLLRLQMSGIQIERLMTPVQAEGQTLPAGTILLKTAQPFRGYLVDLMEPQKYPDIRSSANGGIKRPYDIAGWTLPMQMGVDVVRLGAAVAVTSEAVAEIPPLTVVRNHRDGSFFAQMADLLEQGRALRWTSDGQLMVEGEAPQNDFNEAPYAIRLPRVGVYLSWMANIDAGWTEWLLDHEHVAHAPLHNADIQRGGLNEKFDSIVLPAQSADAILHGYRKGQRIGERQGDAPPILQRPEYTGGLGLAGLSKLEEFVNQGGWLITFDQAGEVAANGFDLPVRLLLHPTAESEGPTPYYCPGSILRATFDTKAPVAFGMPANGYVFSSGGQAYENLLLPDYNKDDREVHVVGRYAATNVLASGFLSGEASVAGKSLLIDVRLGKGHILMFGFRPQFRGQSWGTFRLVLNAVYLASARISGAAASSTPVTH
jgi:hypothetical protein